MLQFSCRFAFFYHVLVSSSMTLVYRFKVGAFFETQYICVNKGKGKSRYSSSWEPHLRATGRHLPYGITQCYLPPDTSEDTPP